MNLRWIAKMIVLNPEIPQALKMRAIELYLQGESRNNIALKLSISQGAVSNAITAWKASLAASDVESLRELGIMLKKSGLTAVECTAGLRVTKALQSLAVPDENLLDFINIIYLRCKEIGLDPQKFSSLAKQLLDLTNSVPIVQIPQYLEDKQREKSQLEQDIGVLREQEAKAKFDLELALNEQQITTSQLSIFSEQRTRLEAAGVSVGDLELFTRCIEGAKKLGFDIKRLTMLLSDFDFSRAMQVELEKSIESSKTHLQHLKYQCDILESQISMHNITILKLRQLEDMGLGIPQLLVLHETAHEIARAYNIPQNLAVQRTLK